MGTLSTPAEAFPPGEFLRDELEERGWTEAEFADILGRPAQAVSEILNGKKEITAETAVAIGAALDTSAELWLNLQSAYRLHTVRSHRSAGTEVERRAALRRVVPIRELQKRGWLPDTKDIDILETAICDFVGVASPDERPTFGIAARRTNADQEFTPEQTAWIARVRTLGARRTAAPLDIKALALVAQELTRRVRTPTDLSRLPEWLGDVGVVLVIELPLKSSKIDGVVIFGTDGTPIIGLSTRGDRMDGFLFTLLHEIAHVVLGHVTEGDVRLDEEIVEGNLAGREAEANQRAAAWALPERIALGVGKPSMQRIIAEAHAIGVHPSLIIGRLQRDRVLDWGDYRRSVPKVRPFVRLG